jgi:uncharacterized protein (DUF362 family)
MSATRVALVRGQDRHEYISQALALISRQAGFSTPQSVLINPNFVVTQKPLAATHADALRAVLDFVRSRYEGPITIAEGPSTELASEGFRRLGYEALARSYDAVLLDLNHDETVPVGVYDWQLRPLRLHLARSVVASDFRISVGPPKTHNVVLVTMSLKNMIMGTLISRFTHGKHSDNGREGGFGTVQKVLWKLVPPWVRPLVPPWVRQLPPVEWLQFRAMSTLEPSDKMKMHQSHAVINLNLALIAPRVVPHLAVIDGFQAMEGAGPTDSTSGLGQYRCTGRRRGGHNTDGL